INEAISAGSNTLTFSVPPGAVAGQSFVRFRFRDFSGVISFDGLVENGEVEDYSVNIEEAPVEYDFGDAPENPMGEYPTTIANNGARHVIVPGTYLGGHVDAEPDGQPGINADCDDTDCLFPSLGDDEDGVSIPDSVSPGQSVSINVIASVDGFLDGWMDFDLNESWADTGENIFVSTPLTTGANTLVISIPATASLGQSFLRFRFRDYIAPLGFDGVAANGEVEDYAVLIVQPQFNIDVKVIIGGAVMPGWDIGEPNIMDTVLNASLDLPIIQPYDDASAIWYYPGTETVLSIPQTNIVDWVILELRETSGGPATATSTTIIDRQAAFLLSNGSVVSLDGKSLPSVNYMVSANLYVVVWHRNHLGIMSASPLNYDGLFTRSYDFTTAAGQAYGSTNAQTEIAPGYFGMMPGDANGDGQVDLLDKNNVWDIIVGGTGYLSSDFNLDSQVNNQDKNGAWFYFNGKVVLIP
ncbi:MAG: hypothetical protein GXO89_01840, partial [Chlorobi bacterium]|nr:hypothetical protein [Chlorobiota bacterium]